MTNRLLLCLLLCAGLSGVSTATPPDYVSFDREQRVQHQPVHEDLMRIWIPVTGQGDAILVQLPLKYAYELELETDEIRDEPMDIVIDSGSFLQTDRDLFRDFLHQVYPNGALLEYAVISHHDSDHVTGFGPLLADPDFGVEYVYHNGLASYRPGHRGFPANGEPERGSVNKKNRDGQVTRWMAYLDDSDRLSAEELVNNLDALRDRFDSGQLHNIYANLAESLLTQESPTKLVAFDRLFSGRAMILGDDSAGEDFIDDGELSFEVIWPLETPSAFGSGSQQWGKTINGNSVTFQLQYGDFQMLFTGDHNAKSEPHLLTHLDSTGITETDVLKVPHHGSDKADEDWFRDSRINPVLSVASLGSTGFKSKRLSRNAWQHPSTRVIGWLGGSHRVYFTYIHEKRFRWGDLEDQDDHDDMVEEKHILIETDGEWFRLVETDDPQSIPSVHATRRGDGTRWIRARSGQ